MATTLPTNSAERKEHPIYSGPLRYFPAALAAVAKVCKIGNDKHNPGLPLQHDRAKSKDHADCIVRHLIDLAENDGREHVAVDPVTGDVVGVWKPGQGVPQVAYIAWRALALCQEWLEKHEGKPVAPAATNAVPAAPDLPSLFPPLKPGCTEMVQPERREGPKDRRTFPYHFSAVGFPNRSDGGRRSGDPQWHYAKLFAEDAPVKSISELRGKKFVKRGPNSEYGLERRTGPASRRTGNNNAEALRQSYRRVASDYGRRSTDTVAFRDLPSVA